MTEKSTEKIKEEMVTLHIYIDNKLLYYLLSTAKICTETQSAWFIENMMLPELQWGSSLSTLSTQPEPSLQIWMTKQDSLTQNAQRQCQDVCINLQQQIWAMPDVTEIPLLPETGELFIREIIMMCNHKAWWFARTLIPSRTFFRQAEQFANLHDKPLGSILFSAPYYPRKYCKFAQLNRRHFIFQRAMQTQRYEVKHLWARQSKFILLGGPLLLFEVFLPEMLHGLGTISSL